MVNTVDPPAEVKLWQATNPSARDFRVENIGQGLASATEAAVELPLPTTLAGTSIRVTGSNGVGRLAAAGAVSRLTSAPKVIKSTFCCSAPE